MPSLQRHINLSHFSKFPYKMATADESPTEEKPPVRLPKSLEGATQWIDYAAEQVLIYQKNIQETLDEVVEHSKSRLSQIRSTSSAHLRQTIDSLQDVKSVYGHYENVVFAKVKEGINVAVAHPLISGGVALGIGSLALKRSRRLLYYRTLRLVVSEEALLSRADTKAKELRQAISQLKAESDKLARRASLAEEELIRGRTKLRQAGKQIQGVISSAYKIERQTLGLKDIIRELPGREASRFRSEAARLASDGKQERNVLTKEVAKISNYGISV